MATANERQVGGSHYGGGGYQHWDWVHDVRLAYHPATASKYVDRWREKNGVQDLEKALHYAEKSEELGIQGSSVARRAGHFWKYVIGRNTPLVDAVILWLLMEGQWADAIAALKGAIERERSPS